MNALKASPKLEWLFLDRDGKASFTIPAVLALPHLRGLTLHDNGKKPWLQGVLPQLESATALTHLTLAADGLPPDAIEHLRQALPACDVAIKPAGAYGH